MIHVSEPSLTVSAFRGHGTGHGELMAIQGEMVEIHGNVGRERAQNRVQDRDQASTVWTGEIHERRDNHCCATPVRTTVDATSTTLRKLMRFLAYSIQRQGEGCSDYRCLAAFSRRFANQAIPVDTFHVRFVSGD